MPGGPQKPAIAARQSAAAKSHDGGAAGDHDGPIEHIEGKWTGLDVYLIAGDAIRPAGKRRLDRRHPRPHRRGIARPGARFLLQPGERWVISIPCRMRAGRQWCQQIRRAIGQGRKSSTLSGGFSTTGLAFAGAAPAGFCTVLSAGEGDAWRAPGSMSWARAGARIKSVAENREQPKNNASIGNMPRSNAARSYHLGSHSG